MDPTEEACSPLFQKSTSKNTAPTNIEDSYCYSPAVSSVYGTPLKAGGEERSATSNVVRVEGEDAVKVKEGEENDWQKEEDNEEISSSQSAAILRSYQDGYASHSTHGLDALNLRSLVRKWR